MAESRRKSSRHLKLRTEYAMLIEDCRWPDSAFLHTRAVSTVARAWLMRRHQILQI